MVGVVLEPGVGDQRAVGADDVEEGLNDRARATDHPAERAHLRVDHDHAAVKNTEIPQLADEAWTSP
ncbi:MAG: hypothetical protein ACP5P1_12560 [Acidimicrobiales bacterium]